MGAPLILVHSSCISTSLAGHLSTFSSHVLHVPCSYKFSSLTAGLLGLGLAPHCGSLNLFPYVSGRGLLGAPQLLVDSSCISTSLAGHLCISSHHDPIVPCSQKPLSLLSTGLLELGLEPGCGSPHLPPSVSGSGLCVDR